MQSLLRVGEGNSGTPDAGLSRWLFDFSISGKILEAISQAGVKKVELFLTPFFHLPIGYI